MAACTKHFLIQKFESTILFNYDLNRLSDIKLICASLLFTLIPIHNNEKCYDYYNLLYNILSSELQLIWKIYHTYYF